MMTDGAEAYEVVVPPELATKWAGLASDDLERLTGRLDQAARRASSHPTTWGEGPVGAHRGKHRAVVDELWVLYRLNDAARTLTLIGFGQVEHAARQF
jgi:hypothetical protein